jgi:hypothetical protein
VAATAGGLIRAIEGEIDEFVTFLAAIRPAALAGASLAEVMDLPARNPAQLRALHRAASLRPERLQAAPPTIAIAALGQARADGAVSAKSETATLGGLLDDWALRRALARQPEPQLTSIQPDTTKNTRRVQ